MRGRKRKKQFVHIDLFDTFQASCGLSDTTHRCIAKTPADCKVSQGFPFFNPMPKAAPKPCSQPGCGVLVRDGTSRCAKHQREAWTKKPTETKRVTGRKLQAMRERLFKGNPLCAECERQGRVTLATQRDHIKPLAEGGTDDDDNVQGLCKPCHDAKSKDESQRGRGRWTG